MLEVRSFLHQFLESFEFFSIDLKIEFKFPVKGGEDLLPSLQGTSHNRINTNKSQENNNTTNVVRLRRACTTSLFGQTHGDFFFWYLFRQPSADP